MAAVAVEQVFSVLADIEGLEVGAREQGRRARRGLGKGDCKGREREWEVGGALVVEAQVVSVVADT